jgi:hypothetical protein
MILFGASGIAAIISAVAESRGNTVSPWISGGLACVGVLWLIISLPFAAFRVAHRERLARLDAESRLLETLPDFHAKCNFVSPLPLGELGVSVIATVRLENRGMSSQIDNWELWANVDGVPTCGIVDSSVAAESHIMELTSGQVERGHIRQGALSALFRGATPETLSLKTVTFRFRDAFGRAYESESADDKDICVRPFGPSLAESPEE